jgi:hypothetical protein
MFDIAQYLEKFKNIISSQDFLRNSVAESIREVCSINIDPKNIIIKNYTARINDRPIVKTSIFFKKTKILGVLDKKTNGKIKDIL